MLCLTVKYGERVILHTSDGDVIVQQLPLNRLNQPRLGFEAPKSIEIERENAVDKQPRPRSRTAGEQA